jgi:hypothetical protein
MKFDTLIRYKALDQVYNLGNPQLVDHFLNNPEVQLELGTKKIQFDATPDLFKDLEEVVGILSMSKREFLQAAVFDAVKKAKLIINEEEVFENMEAHQQAENAAYEAAQDSKKC